MAELSEFGRKNMKLLLRSILLLFVGMQCAVAQPQIPNTPAGHIAPSERGSRSHRLRRSTSAVSKKGIIALNTRLICLLHRDSASVAALLLTLSEAMLTESGWEPLARDQGIEDVLERFSVEFGCFRAVR